jgi:NAD(P)-dependent dehydrogenase (short-subunit alcohol dehydrogenase family)
MPAYPEKLKKAFDFSGRTVVMSGATGVMGSEIALALAECGARLAILNRNPENGNALLERLSSYAQNVALFRADVMQIESLRQAATEIVARFGKIDALINGAGGNQPKATTSADLKFFDLPLDAQREDFDLNLLGTILCSQVFGKIFADHGDGVILNISSMNAFRPLTRIPAYSAAKASVNNFTQWLATHMAQEYSPRIRVNAIAPGFFLTRQNRFLVVDRETGDWTPRGKAILAHTPMGRFGEIDDLIAASLWLLSPASAFVTGAIVPIDGGFSAYSGV